MKEGSQILYKASKNRRLEFFFRIFLQASWTHVPKIFLVPFELAQTEPKGNLYLRHMFGQKCEFIHTKTTKEASQILWKPSKNRVWGFLRTFLKSFYEHLGHLSPKYWILETFGSALGSQDDRFASNLEAQDLPKSMQEREKVDVQK